MSQRAAHSHKNQPPPIDPALQSKLVAKFGTKLMRQGFTALPVMVQKFYRQVPGNPYWKEVIDPETGEVCQVERISYMTPTEYSIMTAIWSSWWTNGNDPWPSVEHIRDHVRKSERQVRRYLQRLRDKGFMLSLEQYNAEGKQISNRYDFSPFLKRLVVYLDALELREKVPHALVRDDKNTEQSVSESPGNGCQNNQGNQIEEETDTFNKDESSSSGSAASQKGTVLPPSPPESLSPDEAIRKSKEGTNTTQPDEAPRTSNRSPTSEELGAAARVEAAKDEEDQEKGARFETSRERGAAAVGISPAHLEILEQGTRKRPDVPFFLEACISEVSRQLNDANPNSSISQANNLHSFYADQIEGFGEEAFRTHLFRALHRANHLADAEVAVRHNDKANRMPTFFGAFRASLRRAYGIEPLGSGRKAPTSPPDLTAASFVPETVVESPVVPDAPEVLPEHDEAIQSPRRPERTNEQTEARERYATKVRTQLRQHGVAGSHEMIIDHEHLICGCPLYSGSWKCVHCYPDRSWEQDVLVLIDTILEH